MGASQNLHFIFISTISAAAFPPPTHTQSGHRAPIKPQHSSCGIVHRPPLTGASSRRRFLSAQPSSSRLPPSKRCANRSDRVTATLHARTMAENSEVKSPSVPRRNIRSNFLFCGTDLIVLFVVLSILLGHQWFVQEREIEEEFFFNNPK